jgi:hypothetical protein
VTGGQRCIDDPLHSTSPGEWSAPDVSTVITLHRYVELFEARYGRRNDLIKIGVARQIERHERCIPPIGAQLGFRRSSESRLAIDDQNPGSGFHECRSHAFPDPPGAPGNDRGFPF